MKIYAIAELTEFGLTIVRSGLGHEGDYPPAFLDRERAQASCDTHQSVVELELVTEHEVAPLAYSGNCAKPATPAVPELPA